MQESVVCNLILTGDTDAFPEVDYLGMDAAGKRSMYYVVMPNK